MDLGIDIGGTKIRAIFFDDKNRQIFGFNIETPKNKKAFLKNLEAEIGKLVQKYKISGIGVGLPGVVDKNRGILIKAPHISFLKNWQAEKFFSTFSASSGQGFSKNIEIENDSRCFALAEFKLGAGRGFKDIVGLTIGTGIGGGIIINGKIYYGKNNSAGEFGHMIIGIMNNELGIKNFEFEKLAAKEAFIKYGDRSEIIGIGVANIINILNPEMVILGGGGVVSGKIKLETVKKTAKKYIISPSAQKTPIVKGKLGEDSPAIGAAMLINLEK